MADHASVGKNPTKRRALKFVLLIGVVSFFADFTYEGARSITGPYLAILGASATLVGFIAGFGELLGYGLRLVSGRLSERTGEFWPITLFGYVVQMSAVPLLALAPNWQIAGLLIMVERIGKAIRNPPRDVMLSHAAKQIGYGWGFGLHEALDQFGALFGPLVVGSTRCAGKLQDRFCNPTRARNRDAFAPRFRKILISQARRPGSECFQRRSIGIATGILDLSRRSGPRCCWIRRFLLDGLSL